MLDAYRRGAALFDDGRPFVAHEIWEVAWRRCRRDAPVARLLAGLIQLAAAQLQRTRGRSVGAANLARRAAANLRAADEPVLAAAVVAWHHHGAPLPALRSVTPRALSAPDAPRSPR